MCSFIDIVGYSKLVTSEQRRLLELLNQIVHESEHFRAAEAKGRLITVPTGDGMALVFYNTPEAPVECALEVSSAASEHPELKLRIGIHSGPVSGVVDVSGRSNIAGAGINIAQRVMDCGDAGHILVSKHMAEDLEQYGHWKRHLHDLGRMRSEAWGARFGSKSLHRRPRESRSATEVSAGAESCCSSGSRKEGPRLGYSSRGCSHCRADYRCRPLVAAFCARRDWHWRTARTPAPPATPMPTAAAIPEKSIAVLPFENLSEDKANAYFADGIQDEILTRLSKIADLKVISRTSTQQYQSKPGNLSEIAKQLGVAHILEGSVQKAGNAVHINVQLIKAATDAHLWGESYDRELQNIFGVEGEVAKAIADQLRAKLTGQEEQVIAAKPTDNPEAYDAYLRGLAYSLKTINNPPTPLAHRNISKKRCGWTRSSLLRGRCSHTPMRLATA